MTPEARTETVLHGLLMRPDSPKDSKGRPLGKVADGAHEAIAEAIRAAVLAERESCADIAYRKGEELFALMNGQDWPDNKRLNAQGNTATEIGNLIRARAAP